MVMPEPPSVGPCAAATMPTAEWVAFFGELGRHADRGAGERCCACNSKASTATGRSWFVSNAVGASSRQQELRKA
jgi:hypothetical protein